MILDLFRSSSLDTRFRVKLQRAGTLPDVATCCEVWVGTNGPFVVSDFLKKNYIEPWNGNFRIDLLILLLFTLNLSAVFEDYKFAKAYNAGDYKKAQSVLERSLIDAPFEKDNLYNLANTFYMQKDFQQAANYYEKLNEQDLNEKEKEESIFNLGNSNAQLKKYKEALENYENVLKINPENERARKNYEIIKKMLEEQQKQQNKDNKNDQEKKDQQKDDQNQDQDQKENKSDNSGEKDKDQTDNSEDKKDELSDSKDENEGKEPRKKDRKDNAKNQSNKERSDKSQDDKKERERGNKSDEVKDNRQDSSPSQHQIQNSKDGDEDKLPLSQRQAKLMDQLDKIDNDLNKQLIKILTANEADNENNEYNW